MAVPVQTWGSLGTMVGEQREFGQKTQEYLESQEAYDLFAYLMRQVMVNQPESPNKFLQDLLRNKPPLAVCVIGPPGINRSKYCQHLAQDYKIKHIDVGKLLANKKELRETIDAGKLVEDSVVIQIVKAEVAKAAKTGWVLDGFPRTKVQAQALAVRETGFPLDKVLLLNTGEKAIRERYAAKTPAGFNSAEREEHINRRLQQYLRHVITIAELFKNSVRQIDVNAGDECFDLIYNTIKSNLHVRPYANAPLRSHRVCVIGPCASGRTTQCRAIAKNYGLVHVDLALLLRKHQADSGQQQDGTPPEWVEDEELCAIVGKRLSQIDCQRKGWVLDGFPKTVAQAEFLRQAHHWPTRLLNLRLSEEAVCDRISTRQVDPQTGAAYYKPPQNAKVAQRLVTADFDALEQVKSRYALHGTNVEGVVQALPTVSFTVSAEEEATAVTAALYERIDEPTATELSQDPTSES